MCRLKDNNRRAGNTLTSNVNNVEAPFDYTWLIEVLPG